MTGRFSFTDVTEPVTICDVNKYHKLLSVFQGRVQFPTGGTVRDLAVPYGGAG